MIATRAPVGNPSSVVPGQRPEWKGSDPKPTGNCIPPFTVVVLVVVEEVVVLMEVVGSESLMLAESEVTWRGANFDN